MPSEIIAVVNNTEAKRFEVSLDGKVAVAEYRLAEGVIEFVHTDVPRDLEGRGIASHLARAGLDYARAQKLGVVPRCPFFAAWIGKHPEYQDLVREP